MSRGPGDKSEARRRLQPELEARDKELTRLRETAEEDARTIEALRDSLGQDAAKIDQLQEEALESERVERAHGP